MKLRYFSDLHLEFIKLHKFEKIIKNIKPNQNEICILAGDIGNPQYLVNNNYDIFMKFINKSFKKTFIITGNHEYYHKTSTVENTNTFLDEYFKQFENISFLNNTYEYYDNHCFIGTTLWSKITNPKYIINDMYHIPNFDYIKCNQLNMICVDFLEDTVEKNDNCIIITHHVPSHNLIDIKYKTSRLLPYNQCFYYNMDNFIEKNKDKIAGWFYGHTHTPSSTIIHGIPFLCNPIGYPDENQEIDFHKIKTI